MERGQGSPKLEAAAFDTEIEEQLISLAAVYLNVELVIHVSLVGRPAQLSGRAHPDCFAGHGTRGAKAKNELAFRPDYSVEADEWIEEIWIASLRKHRTSSASSQGAVRLSLEWQEGTGFCHTVHALVARLAEHIVASFC